MRAAPYGLSVGYDPELSGGEEADAVIKMAHVDADFTHGHPAAREASASLAALIWEIVQYSPQRCDPLEEVVYHCFSSSGLLKKAVGLALDGSVPDLEGIHQLGEGWVADEALAIAVFCAVRYQNDFAAAIRAAVNHKGDSDSTGAICGNILGAWLGEEAVKQAFDLNCLELADIFAQALRRNIKPSGSFPKALFFINRLETFQNLCVHLRLLFPPILPVPVPILPRLRNQPCRRTEQIIGDGSRYIRKLQLF